MFTSPASSGHSNFGSPPVFGQGNQMGNPFASKTMGSTTPFGPSIGISNSNGASTWAFGQTSSPFSAPSSAGFGSSVTTPASSHSSSGIFGQGNQKGDSFGLTTFGTSNTFGSPIGTSNSHGTSTWMFGQTSSPLSSSTTFGAPCSYGFGNSTTLWSSLSTSGGSTFSYKQPDCGGKEQGTRVTPYKITAEAFPRADKLISISAMPVYEAKSHEELRWEDHQLIGKGGFGFNSSGVQSTSSGLSPFAKFSTTPVQPNPFAKPFTSLATQTPTWNFPGPTQTPTSFTSQTLGFPSSSNTCLTTVTAAPPLNLSKPSVPFTNPFTSVAPTPSTSCTSNSFTPLNQNPFTNPFTSVAPTPSTSCTSNSFTPLNQNPFTNPFTSPAPTPSTNCTSTSLTPFNLNSFPKPFISPAPQTSSLNTFWSTPVSGPSSSSATSAVFSASFSPVSSGLSSTFNNPTPFPKPSGVPSTQTWNGAITGIAGQNSVAQVSTSTEQLSPFGTLPPKPQLFLEGSRSIQYGISSIPVQDKPAPVRCLSLLTTRHLSRRSKLLPVHKYDPKLNGPKVPYFSNTKDILVDVFVPRENPRALVVSPEKRAARAITIMHKQKFYYSETGDVKASSYPDEVTKEKQLLENVPSKLEQSDYYTQPEISELEMKERGEPGFCSRVKDFVIGRHGYGSIKFLGETDVRKLHLESYVQFNKREVIVYMDETKKPPVGEGLNKPAEVTLLNIKCIDKRTGNKYTDGLKIDKYKEMLKKKAVTQGAEFVSFDPVEGEWKFRVQHF